MSVLWVGKVKNGGFMVGEGEKWRFKDWARRRKLRSLLFGIVLRINPRPWPNLPRTELPNRECKQIWGDGLVHDKLLNDSFLQKLIRDEYPRGLTPERRVSPHVLGKHDSGEANKDVEAGRVANLYGGRVLTGEDGSGMDC